MTAILRIHLVAAVLLVLAVGFATTARAASVDGRRVHVYRVAPHEVTFLWGQTPIFAGRYVRCANPHPYVVRADRHRYTDSAVAHWCGSDHRFAWIVRTP